jgi:hypothetical protein
LLSAHSVCLKSASLDIASLNITGYLANGTRATIRGSGRTETGAMAPFGIDIADLSADGRQGTGGGTDSSATVYNPERISGSLSARLQVVCVQTAP